MSSFFPRFVRPNSARRSRLGKPKDYNGYFPWTPPASREAWDSRRRELREQILVANGLWPMPEKIALQPVIHGPEEFHEFEDGSELIGLFGMGLVGHFERRVAETEVRGKSADERSQLLEFGSAGDAQ